MKKLMFVAAMVSAFTVIAADAAKTEDSAVEKPAEVAQQEKSIFSAYANYGFYSGYQLYGSIVNTEPVLQSYAEVLAALSWDDLDLGQLSVGLWHNSDLTGKRNDSLRRAFNEFDFNIAWRRMFWFDDDKTWGIFYKSYVVWYFYPHTGAHRPNTKTTFDWDHYFELANPYIVPYINVVHEYEQSHGNLLQFGLKRDFAICDGLTITPFVECVWRNRNYGWCFSNFGNDPEGRKISQGLATLKLELDANYWFTQNVGVFAKVAFCTNLDPNLREACDYARDTYGAAYGRDNEFVWGGVGIQVAF